MILGAGTMGSGIAQVVAEAGHQVVMVDVAQEFLDRGLAAIKKNLQRNVDKGKLTEAEKEAICSRIKGSTNMEQDIAGVDLVIEAVIENLQVKKDVFRQLDNIAAPETIFATNTSAISITEIASATRRPDKVIGMHFFNPAPVMKLVEVIKGIATSNATVEFVKNFAIELGKTPVEVNEAPGFVVNRILLPMINEAAFVAMEGVASPEAIDTAMKLGTNQPIGPLALADLIGLDVCLAIMETLYAEFGDPKYRPCPLIKKMVRAGYLGRKTGRGFYTYN